MDQRYNFYNFEASFKQYLLAGNRDPITVKNYISDLRHFLGWLTFKSKVGENQSQNMISLITLELVEEYKSYLTQNNIPIATVNRRLSTLRKFCSFCISQGWMKENTAKKVSNVLPPHTGGEDEVLHRFKQTVNHTIFTDVAEFFHIISS